MTADRALTVPLRRDPPKPTVRHDAQDHERYGTDGYRRPPDAEEQQDRPQEHAGHPDTPTRMPKKLTVTRVAALRSRELTGRAVDMFHRAHKADGADKSGLTELSWAVMLNYIGDAALAVALANTLFFAAADGESKGMVALYLLVTMAPFAVIAPLIGPALDRIQRGRRLAMAAASAGQALMCLIIAVNFDNWLLYPAALGKIVLSRSFMVLKSSVTPRVVPAEITLSKTNARLTIFGLAAGGVGGTIAVILAWPFGSPGALVFAAVIGAAGAAQAMRIPSWVESTEGEVPATLHQVTHKARRVPMGREVVVGLWGAGTMRLLTGFLTMFAAFAIKAQIDGTLQQLLLLGVIGGAAGIGGFLGNGLGSRMHFGRPDQVIVGAIAGTLFACIIATVMQGVPTAAIVALVGATASALAKISLDAIIQHDLPDESRASAFGRSETVLQLSWCFGGTVGLLLPPTYWIGFLVIAGMMSVGLAQTMLVRTGRSLLPSRRPSVAPGRNRRASGGQNTVHPGRGEPHH